MKIKTIVRDTGYDFDKSVNEALEEGYLLERREVLPDAVAGFKHYAQLVLPDPPAEPETPDPVEALRQVQAHCAAMTREECPACPLRTWCDLYAGDTDPNNWIIPEVLDE